MRKARWVGIDVSAKTLHVALDEGRRLEFENSAVGHQKLCRTLTKGAQRARVCVEATGIYSLDLALALHRRKGIEVMVANPRATKDFTRARMQRSKTDSTDAEAILEFAHSMPFVSWTPPAPEILDLRAISRRITALTTTAAQERNRIHASDQTEALTGVLRTDAQAHIEYLEKSIATLTREAQRILRRSSDLRRKYAHLVSVKGIAETSAIRILAELSVLARDMSPRQWVAHAGLDPRAYESGSSVHKPARISKTGNRHLRAALFMPALVAVQHEPHVRAFYEKLLARGKTKMQATVAVMRKLLHSIHGMLHHDQDFDGEKFFAMEG